VKSNNYEANHYVRASTAVGYSLDDKVSRVRFLAEMGIFLPKTMSRTALGPTQPPIQWVPGAPSVSIKWPGHAADHSPPSSAKVKNAWGYTSTPPILHGIVLSCTQEQLYLPFFCVHNCFFVNAAVSYAYDSPMLGTIHMVASLTLCQDKLMSF
jgi:hypothetical protein